MLLVSYTSLYSVLCLVFGNSCFSASCPNALVSFRIPLCILVAPLPVHHFLACCCERIRSSTREQLGRYGHCPPHRHHPVGPAFSHVSVPLRSLRPRSHFTTLFPLVQAAACLEVGPAGESAPHDAAPPAPQRGPPVQHTTDPGRPEPPGGNAIPVKRQRHGEPADHTIARSRGFGPAGLLQHDAGNIPRRLCRPVWAPPATQSSRLSCGARTPSPHTSPLKPLIVSSLHQPPRIHCSTAFCTPTRAQPLIL